MKVAVVVVCETHVQHETFATKAEARAYASGVRAGAGLYSGDGCMTLVSGDPDVAQDLEDLKAIGEGFKIPDILAEFAKAGFAEGIVRSWGYRWESAGDAEVRLGHPRSEP